MALLEIDSRFSQLSSSEIQLLYDHFDKDDDIRNASNIALKTLFSGGLVFDKIPFKMSLQQLTEYSKLWQVWCEQIWRSLWCLGFAVSSYRPHDQWIMIPTVLDLTQIDVWYYRELDSICHFRLFHRNNEFFSDIFKTTSKGITADMSNREIKNIEIFTNHNKIPTHNGEFRSLVSTLIHSHSVYSSKLRCSLSADSSRARPLFITESVPDKPQNNNTVSAIPITAQYTGNVGDESNSSGNVMKLAAETQLGFLHSLSNLSDRNSLVKATNKIRSYYDVNAKAIEDQYAARIYIEDGRKIAQTTIPQGPDDLSEYRILKMENTFTAFGIPASIITNINSKRRGGGTASSGNSGTVSNSDAKTLMLDLQSAMKHETISMLMKRYNSMFMIHHANQLMNEEIGNKRRKFEEERKEEIEKYKSHKQKKLKRSIEEKYDENEEKESNDFDKRLEEDWDNQLNLLNASKEELLKASQVLISIPAIPDDDTLDALRRDGVLDYDYYIKAKSARHGIPLEAFLKKPEVTVPELNGIMPEKKSDSA